MNSQNSRLDSSSKIYFTDISKFRHIASESEKRHIKVYWEKLLKAECCGLGGVYIHSTLKVAFYKRTQKKDETEIKFLMLLGIPSFLSFFF